MAEAMWRPSTERINASQMLRFARYLNDELGLAFENYQQLHRWSVAEPTAFWRAVANFCDIRFHHKPACVFQPAKQFRDTVWFPGGTLNFAEHLLRYRDDRPALVEYIEDGHRREISFAELYEQVAELAVALRQAGVRVDDRVAGYMPNVIETVVAMLATASIGAVWSSCSPDFGLHGVLDRFGQIKPKVLITLDGYRYNGKSIDTLPRVREIASQLSSLEQVVVVPVLARDGERGDISAIDKAQWWDAFMDRPVPGEFGFEPTAFNHPLYIMYSSGTTGAPKCIVHGAGGTLIQHLKEHQLHVGLSQDDVMFYFTTCGWMMWNWLVSGLASGATLVLYDGSPFVRAGHLLLDMIDAEGITVFGTSAKFIAALEKAGVKPRESHQLQSLKTILSTGSPLLHESYDYVYRDFKTDVCLSSISGGTDIISCFVLGNDCLPVYRGELQCPGLGMAVEIWDENGKPVTGAKGELVCTVPFPSCPVAFLNDPDGQRFHQAYFARFDNVWAHGDYGEFTEHGGLIIHGRSDAVLNPGGVRIGTAEIYRQVEKCEEILESIVIGQQWQGDVRVVLFVVLREGAVLDEALQDKIKATIRANTTPRHVPAKILAVPEIPRTLSGKIVELAVRNVVHGEPVKNTDALANPEALKHFENRIELQS